MEVFYMLFQHTHFSNMQYQLFGEKGEAAENTPI